MLCVLQKGFMPSELLIPPGDDLLPITASFQVFHSSYTTATRRYIYCLEISLKQASYCYLHIRR